MGKNDDRFIVTYKQAGFITEEKILVDTQTGVNYLWCQSSNAGGLTVLLDRDGKPVISALPLEP